MQGTLHVIFFVLVFCFILSVFVMIQVVFPVLVLVATLWVLVRKDGLGGVRSVEVRRASFSPPFSVDDHRGLLLARSTRLLAFSMGNTQGAVLAMTAIMFFSEGLCVLRKITNVPSVPVAHARSGNLHERIRRVTPPTGPAICKIGRRTEDHHLMVDPI